MNSYSNGLEASNLEPITLPRKSISVIINELNKVAKSWQLNNTEQWRKDKLQDEFDLNSSIVNYFNAFTENSSRIGIYLGLEQKQSERFRVDLSVMYVETSEPCCVFECKRLPTPNGRDRQFEYVTQIQRNGGGIQRFKNGSHGAELEIVGMIGYIQDEQNMNDWRNTINSWITDFEARNEPVGGLNWTQQELLALFADENSNEDLARYSSIHPRTENRSDVTIHHLWVRINTTASNRNDSE